LLDLAYPFGLNLKIPDVVVSTPYQVKERIMKSEREERRWIGGGPYAAPVERMKEKNYWLTLSYGLWYDCSLPLILEGLGGITCFDPRLAMYNALYIVSMSENDYYNGYLRYTPFLVHL
jgi:hypothetical protein